MVYVTSVKISTSLQHTSIPTRKATMFIQISDSNNRNTDHNMVYPLLDGHYKLQSLMRKSGKLICFLSNVYTAKRRLETI